MSDLISRQAAYETLTEYYHHRTEIQHEALKEALNRVPSAEKRGKWIKNEGRYGWHCSACGEDDLYAFVWNRDTGENELQDRYCPKCGAKMEGVEDATD